MSADPPERGQSVRLSVTNTLDEDTSILWHGLLAPFQTDRVAGVSFPGIRPGETFVYELKVRQAGAYWCHSHSGLQEQEGGNGPIVIDTATPDPVAYDRERVVVLSDYSILPPHQLRRRLKAHAGYFNDQKRTVAGEFAPYVGMLRPRTLGDRADLARVAGERTGETSVVLGVRAWF